MEIEIKEHTSKGLVTRETINADKSLAVVRLGDVLKSYPAHELSNVSFFSFNSVTIFIRRKKESV